MNAKLDDMTAADVTANYRAYLQGLRRKLVDKLSDLDDEGTQYAETEKEIISLEYVLRLMTLAEADVKERKAKASDIPLLDVYARKLEPGEPYFILMGRDPLAAPLVRNWSINEIVARGASEKTAAAQKIADAMEVWSAQKQERNIDA